MNYKIIVDGGEHKFSSAHFIVGHEKCGRLHGHNFYISVDVAGPLNEENFVVDFIDVKNVIKSEMKKLDHRVLIPGKSPDVKILDDGDENLSFSFSGKRYSIPKVDICMLDLPAISSELLAKYFYDRLKKHFKSFRIKVRIGESPYSRAEYGDED
ncbi:MAG: 6-pyruvoyl trahydropterin synthase family protein [Promethearchaeota archaeon]